MALTAGELAQIVWAETKLFGPGAADGTGDVNFIRLSIAQLAASTGGAGFDRREPAPPTNDPALGATARQVMEIAERALSAPAPQRRLILWPASDGPGLSAKADPPPPEPWASLDPSALTRQMRLLVSGGGTVDVFSRAAGPDPDGAPLVNWVSGTGVPPRRSVAQAAATAAPAAPMGVAWALGIAGVVLFVFAGLVAGVAGVSIATARNLLTTTQPAYESALLVKAATLCQQDRAALPGAKRPPLCETLLPGEETFDKAKSDDVARALGRADAAWPLMKDCVANPKGDSCALAWRASVGEVASRDWRQALFRYLLLVSNFVTGAGVDATSISVVGPYFATVIGVAALIIALGLGTQGRPAGVWIDTRNRVSLARAQVTIWTVVVLGAHFVLTMFNVGFAGVLDTLGAFVSGKYEAFPSFPGPVAAALGIAGGSTIISRLILPMKDKRPVLDIRGAVADFRRRGSPFFGNQSSGLDKRASPAEASVADLFMGEENANADTVDIARLQNVVMTISLALSYGAFVISMMSSVPVVSLLSGREAVFTALPDPGANFAWLLAVSHAVYLVSKAHDQQDEGANAAQK